jgi:hypothetical protein
MLRAFMVAVMSLALLGGVRPTWAQVCGDADGSGAVTVSDGVQTLRAAAGLDSMCTVAACDIDGSGAITVTDGVSVLRKAAGLPVMENCSDVSGQPATVLSELQTIFRYGAAFATGPAITSCANPSDGELEVTVDEDGMTTTFSSCEAGTVHLTGDIIVGPSLLTFCGLEADTTGEEDFISDYDGELTLGTAAGGRSLAGTVDVTTDSAGFMELMFADALVVGGKLTAGSATVDLTESDIADAFTQLVLTFDGSGVASVVATESNGSTMSFHYDIGTGTATPAS